MCPILCYIVARLALTAHREALLSLRSFWHMLLHNEVRFEDLTRAVQRIDKTVSSAERVYRCVCLTGVIGAMACKAVSRVTSIMKLPFII